MSFIARGGSSAITVPAGQSIAVGSLGAGLTSVFQLGPVGNNPPLFGQLGTVGGTSALFGPFSLATTIRIDASTASDVEYVVGYAPVLTQGPAIKQAPSIAVASKRPKLAAIGNSLNDRNRLGETSAGYWSAWGFLTWIHALSGDSFDRARSNAFSWGAQGNPGGAEQIDSLGCYGWGGSQINSAFTYSMLTHLPNVLQQYIDTPDIVYLSSLFENDIGSNATPNIAQIEASALEAIRIIQQKWPAALIIIACPGPSTSYTTTAQHAAFVTLTNWIQALPQTNPQVMVENNTAMILAGTVDQPVPSYVSDAIVHQNERGAYVRAKAFLAQFGSLFTKPMAVPQSPYLAALPSSQYQRNPNFSLIGAPGGAIGGVTYTSYDWYADANVVGTVTANAIGSGVNVALSASGAVASGAGLGITSDAQSTTVQNNATLKAMAQVTILNPANLAEIALSVNFSGGAASTYGLAWQGTFLTVFPQGMSDIWQSGDTFTLTTPPLTPGSTNTTCAYTSVKPVVCAALNAATPAAQQPVIQITAQNVVQVGNNAPVGITIATTATYQNTSSGLQQISITGNGTWTSLTVTRDGTVVPLPAANGIVVLAPGDVLTPTYSAGAPVFNLLQLN